MGLGTMRIRYAYKAVIDRTGRFIGFIRGTGSSPVFGGEMCKHEGLMPYGEVFRS